MSSLHDQEVKQRPERGYELRADAGQVSSGLVNLDHLGLSLTVRYPADHLPIRKS